MLIPFHIRFPFDRDKARKQNGTDDIVSSFITISSSFRNVARCIRLTFLNPQNRAQRMALKSPDSELFLIFLYFSFDFLTPLKTGHEHYRIFNESIAHVWYDSIHQRLNKRKTTKNKIGVYNGRVVFLCAQIIFNRIE